MSKTCLECGGPAHFVNAGRDIGQYYWCPACKKEEQEWVRPQAATKPEPAPVSGKYSYSLDMHPIYKLYKLYGLQPGTCNPAAAGDCKACGASIDSDCDPNCPDNGPASADAIPF
jgi:hypothetical protein